MSDTLTRILQYGAGPELAELYVLCSRAAAEHELGGAISTATQRELAAAYQRCEDVWRGFDRAIDSYVAEDD